MQVKPISNIAIVMGAMLSGSICVAENVFDGLVQGQAVIVKETRTEPFIAKEAIAPNNEPFKGLTPEVGTYMDSENLRWWFNAGSRLSNNHGLLTNGMDFEGALADLTGESTDVGPVWKVTSAWKGSVGASINLIPAEQMPEGTWMISAEFSYAVETLDEMRYFFEGPPIHYFTEVGLLLHCSAPAPAVGVTNESIFVNEEQNFASQPVGLKSSVLKAALVGNLDSCRERGGYIYLQVTVRNFNRFQYKGIRVSMAKIGN